MKRLNIFVTACILSMLFCLQNCSTGDPAGPATADFSKLEKRVAQSGNLFGLKLFREIVASSPDTNIFVSPLSVSMALGMTLNGANGETADQMEKALELSGLSSEQINETYQSLKTTLTGLDTKVLFEIANSIWYRDDMTFEQPFINTNQTYFDAEVAALDFADPNSVTTINEWVAGRTHDKISEIISKIEPSMVMFLINAIYFNGTWVYEFDKKYTHDSYFAAPQSQIPCKMMTVTNEFLYMENQYFQAIDLPYGNGTFSMTIILPTHENGVDALIASLDVSVWNSWLSELSADSVTLNLPKFKAEYEDSLNKVLSVLGMHNAFTAQADFTKMYKPGGIFIGFVKHKTFLQVDEEGTEAAAVTAVGMERTSAGPERQIKYMRVDRPFLCVIREKQSESILFIGKITHPKWSD